jgi:hypothetical protein
VVWVQDGKRKTSKLNKEQSSNTKIKNTTKENRAIRTRTKFRYDMLNQQPLIFSAIEGETYVANRNGVRYQLKS